MFRSAMTGAVMCAMLALGSGRLCAQAEGPKLPITKVILYKHGVGYFERTGKVAGDQTIALRFKARDMSDLLKSMTILDLGGGSVRAIAYESTKTVDQQLGEYTFNLRSAQSLPQILEQMKGCDVALGVAGKEIAGRVLTVEKRIERSDKSEIETYILSILLDGGTVKSYKLSEIDDVRFADAKLQAEIQSYLKTLFSRLRRDEKEITIAAAGKGERDLLISYVREQPVWKVSYRIVIEKQEKPLLQAWAIVDNVSEEDWENVSLSLVSGLPVSFIQNLYDPLYVSRPIVPVQQEMSLRPMIYEPGESRDAEKAAPRLRGESSMAFGGALAPSGRVMKMPAPAAPPPNMLDEMSKQVTDVASRETGALFVYHIKEPVTVKRDHSALLPIANARVDGARVSIYNEATRAANPMEAVRLKNSTGLTLEGGALTVIQDNTYAGEALMDTLKPGDERYVAYAVDLGARVITKPETVSQNIYKVRIVRGALYEDYKRQEGKTYSLTNLEAAEKTVVIEYPVRPGWTLVNTAKPIETTQQNYRFEIKLPGKDKAKGPTEFKVIEERQESSTYAVSSVSRDKIVFYVQQKYLDQKTREALEKVVALQAELAGLRTKLADAERERRDISTDQDRVRQNMNTLRDNEAERGLRSRYVKQFTADEDRLGELKVLMLDLAKEIEKKQKALEDFITPMAF